MRRDKYEDLPTGFNVYKQSLHDTSSEKYIIDEMYNAWAIEHISCDPPNESTLNYVLTNRINRIKIRQEGEILQHLWRK